MNEWISVEDALPDTCTYYLCLTDAGWCNYDVLEWFDGWLDCLDAPTQKVTHWMPLPEPPK